MSLPDPQREGMQIRNNPLNRAPFAWKCVRITLDIADRRGYKCSKNISIHNRVSEKHTPYKGVLFDDCDAPGTGDASAGTARE